MIIRYDDNISFALINQLRNSMYL